MVFQYANLALRFLLELCVLVALGYWGFHTRNGWIVKIGLGIGAPLLVALVWAIYGAPGAQVKLPGSLHLILETAIFGLATVALYAVRRPGLAVAFALVVVINRILMYVWGQ